jgi:hypothetical protein
MTTFPGSPRIVKGGLVRVDPVSGAVAGPIIALQYNPDTLTRTLQVQATGGEGADRTEALRLKGPAVETIKVDAEIDLTDQLEFPDQHPNAVQLGLHPYLSALETMVHPTSQQLQTNQQLASAGTLEILPTEAPLTLFIWSRQRIVPVRLTEFSITEEAFDPGLNPIRAKVSLGMRVLSVSDLGFEHRGGMLFMNYLRQKEQLAGKYEGASFGALGVKGV